MQSTAHVVISAARAMVELGYRIEPVRLVLDPPRADGRRKKRMIGAPTEWQTARHGIADPALVGPAFEQFASPGGRGGGQAANAYVIVTGASRVVVIDLDSKTNADGVQSWTEAGGPTSTMTVTTWSGGMHLYFADPHGSWGNRTGLLPGVDVRAVGGLVFGPGSTLIDAMTGDVAGRYTADVRPVRPSDLPGAPVVQLSRVAAPSKAPTTSTVDEFFRPGPQTASAARLAIASALAEVTRHAAEGWDGFRDTLRDAAFTLGGYVGAEFCAHDEAFEHLAKAIVLAGHEPDSDDTLWITQGLVDGARRPFEVRPDPIPAPADSGIGAEPARGPRRLPLMPDQVWDARPWLSAIRDNARARDICPDAVLGATLAIYAANLDHRIRIDTGTKTPLTCTLLVGLVGPSGSDKSTAFAHAYRSAPEGSVLALPTPSGEGLAEQLIGVETTIDPVSGDKIRVRRQMGHNALYWVDEGEILSRTMDRLGATLGGQLRSAWSGQVLGNTNASEDRRRTIPAGSYVFGVCVGYQPRTAVRIIADTHTGMAQRFLWFSALDGAAGGSVPGVAVPDAPRLVMPHVTRLAEVVDPLGLGETEGERLLTVEAGVTALIVAGQRRRRAELDITVDDPDSQRDVMTAKVAGLLALIDDRAMITMDDWQLATAVYAASARVRDELAALADEDEAAERHAAAARQGEADSVRKRYASSVQRVAAVLVRKAASGPLGKADASRALRSADRVYRDQAIEFALHTGWLVAEGSKFALGPAAPAPGAVPAAPVPTPPPA